MINAKSKIRIYIDEKKELQKLIHQIIENPNSDDEDDFQNLIIFLNTHQYKENKPEIEHFLHLILIISLNHYRQPDFFQKIEKILTITSEMYKPHFTDQELFIFFQQSRPILLFLLKSQIIQIDEIIFKQLLKFTKSIENENRNYFYPEIIELIKTGKFDQINYQEYEFKKEDIELFEKNRQKGENESKICSIIREDLIDDFIQYIHQTSTSLSSRVSRSLFETNSVFFENEPTIIEYAAFFGSIRIIKYLLLNKVQFDSSIYLYAVHSNNAEVLSIFEGNEYIKIDDTAFSVAIKCHHNSIANYILENYLENLTNKSNLSDESIYSIFSSDNYEFFPYEFDSYDIFYGLCKSNNYYDLVDFYLELKKEEIEDFISKGKSLNILKINFFFFYKIQIFNFIKS